MRSALRARRLIPGDREKGKAELAEFGRRSGEGETGRIVSPCLPFSLSPCLISCRSPPRACCGVDEAGDLRFLACCQVPMDDPLGRRFVELLDGGGHFLFQHVGARGLVVRDFKNALELFLERLFDGPIMIAPLHSLPHALLGTFQMRHRLSFVIHWRVVRFIRTINLCRAAGNGKNHFYEPEA